VAPASRVGGCSSSPEALASSPSREASESAPFVEKQHSGPVECQFFPISEFVVNNADYVNWDTFAWPLARHVQHRNGVAPEPRTRIRLSERAGVADV
jgi:hypothetical protein